MPDAPFAMVPRKSTPRVASRPRAVARLLAALALASGLVASSHDARAQAVAPRVPPPPAPPVSAARVRNARAFCRAERQYDLARLPLSAELVALGAVALAVVVDRPRDVELTPHQTIAFAASLDLAAAGLLSFFEVMVPTDPMRESCARLVGASERLVATEPRLVTDVEAFIRGRPSWPRVPTLTILSAVSALGALPFDSLTPANVGYTALGMLAAAALTLPIDLLVRPGEGTIARHFQASLPSLSMGPSGIALTTRF